MKEGKVEEERTFEEGFDRLPHALLGLFEGWNTGKMIVREPIPAELQELMAVPEAVAAQSASRGGQRARL